MPGGIKGQSIKCTAHLSDGSGRPCGAYAVTGRTVCYVHGGASLPAGESHPRFKHGRYSKVTPRGLLSTYHAGLSDPNILEMNDELALLGARTSQLLTRAETGESEDRWKAAQDMMRSLLSFEASDDEENRSEAIAELGKILFGKNDYESWREIIGVIDMRRKVASVERARLQAAKQTVTLAQLLAFAGAVSGIINGRISDPVTRSQIAEDIRRLMTREGVGSELPSLTEG